MLANDRDCHCSVAHSIFPDSCCYFPNKSAILTSLSAIFLVLSLSVATCKFFFFKAFQKASDVFSLFFKLSGKRGPGAGKNSHLKIKEIPFEF